MNSKQRFLMKLEFDGRRFCGWQLQSEGEGYVGLPSIQASVEKALATFWGRPGERFPVLGCGRTDAGVHALEYFAHFDFYPDRHQGREVEPYRFVVAMNNLLPEGIACVDVKPVSQDFHALESVQSKIYEYRILLRRARPTLDEGRCLHYILDPLQTDFNERFNLERLRLGLEILKGRHDFIAFAAADGSAKTSVRNILNTELIAENYLSNKNSLILKLRFEGEGFLKQMVRNMVGTLVDIAMSKMDLERLKLLLKPEESGLRRTSAGFCAPPEGLFLVKVNY